MQAKERFGFGCMRLPLLDSQDPASFDFDAIEALFDAYLEKGFTYFDTAYVYHGYRCESAMRKALVERHPRESFELATKLPLRDFKDATDMEKIFAEQLSNCGVDYFDYYLLHNMGQNVYGKCLEHDAFGFIRRKKAEGKILHAGMSLHDTPELLEEILEKYGDSLDFVQLQVNYMDWEQPSIECRRCLEVAIKYGKPVTVMEPCKGGTLANLPPEAETIFRAADPNASMASWAMRYAGSCKGVTRALSGMNSMEQLQDNCAVFADFKPITDSEYELIDQVRQIINANTAVACTACAYCTHGCPQNIAIPQYFGLYNNLLRHTGGFSSFASYYVNLGKTYGKPDDCIGCRQCEKACPQHLPIVDYLKDVAEKFSGMSFPTRK